MPGRRRLLFGEIHVGFDLLKGQGHLVSVADKHPLMQPSPEDFMRPGMLPYQRGMTGYRTSGTKCFQCAQGHRRNGQAGSKPILYLRA